MTDQNRKELYQLSNQMIDLFIKDIFSKNNTNLDKVKANITDEQREALRQSVTHLQDQVEKFMNNENGTKKITEHDQTSSETVSPLRRKLAKKEAEDE